MIATSHTAYTTANPDTRPNRWWSGISTAKVFAADCVSALLGVLSSSLVRVVPASLSQHSTGNQYHFLLLLCRGSRSRTLQKQAAAAAAGWWRGGRRHSAIVRAVLLHILHPSLAASPISINLQLSGLLPVPPPLSCARPLQHRRLRSARHASLIHPSRVIILGRFLANCRCPNLKPPILYHKPQTINY